MILTEDHVIRCKKRKNKTLYQQIDDYCYASKNLYNSTNYLISQCGRISRKLSEGEILDSYEKGMIYQVNCAISQYNKKRPGKRPMAYIDESNGYVADAYFLSWYLKGSENYRSMPYATCSQICIQVLCKAWKAFYQGMKAYHQHPENMLGRPSKPGYLDKDKGRNWLVLTSQNFRIDEKGELRLPSFLDGIRIHPRHDHLRQLRIKTEDRRIIVQLMYEAEERKEAEATGMMGIDPGINNLLTISMDTEAHPIIINGRIVKSINQYYNKKKAELQSLSKISNGLSSTRRIKRLTRKRNQKIKDYMHKASRKVIQLALENQIGTIVIGNNRGWKQETEMGKKTNQSFTSIPHKMLLDMIRYKGEMAGLRVMIMEESYTSGTSYLDGEKPEKQYYDHSRRITRGQFKSNKGILINADVNAAYQIIKKGGRMDQKPKERELVIRINVA